MSLQPLFHPRSVAVIGASRNERSISGVLVRNLMESFRGPLYLVNPHTNRIGVLPSYPSIIHTPGPVDLAFIVVPAQQVLDTARQCATKPVRAIVVISAGFAETGKAADVHEEEILALVRTAQIPLLGPNCLGVLSTDPTGPINGTFGPAMLPAGNIAIATQSGALGFVLPELLRSRNLGISSLVSLGNKLDLGENDFLKHWLGDPAARAILLYLESFQNPRELFEVGRRLSQTRPVILLKAGRTKTGSRAAGSHTAALATPDRLVKGLCRQAGIVRAQTLEETFHATSLLSRQPIPQGKRVAILTNAGGPGVLCADALAEAGCEVPELSSALQEKLRSFAPCHATVRNPIDLVASVDPQTFRHCLQCLIHGDEIDAVVIMYVPRLPGTSLGIARAIQELSGEALSKKTLLAVFFEDEQGIVRLQEALEPIPCFRYPESAACALAIAVGLAAQQTVPELPSVSEDRLASSEGRAIIDRFLQDCGELGGWLGAAETQRLLGGFDLPVPAWQIADLQELAVHAAEQIGFPVVLKAIHPQLLHKFAAGGIVLDVRSSAEVHDAWRVLNARIAGLSAVLVQQYLPGEVEAIIGVKYEAGFGHVIGLGMGGTRAERLRDAEFRLLPLTSHDAYDLVRDSPVAEICLAASGQLTPPGKSVYRALLQISTLVSSIPEIRELDLNPVALFESRDELHVLDIRAFVACSNKQSPNKNPQP